MAVIRLLLLFFFIQNIHASDCGKNQSFLWSPSNKSITICFHPNEFIIRRNGSEMNSYPMLALNDGDSVIRYLEEYFPNEVNSFIPIHKKTLEKYLNGVEERVTDKMTTNVVSTLELLNDSSGYTFNYDCYQDLDSLFPFTNIDFTRHQALVQCTIRVGSLPDRLAKGLEKSTSDGFLNLGEILAHHPDLSLTMRSKVFTDKMGRPKEINPHDDFSIADYLLFDLIIKDKKGETTHAGRCVDEQESYLSLGKDSKVKERLATYFEDQEIDAQSEKPSGIKINRHWALPFSLDFVEERYNDKEGRAQSEYDVGVNTGLTYTVTENRLGSVFLTPEVGIPLIDGVRGVDDVLNINNYDTLKPNYLGLKVFIEW